MHFAFAVTADQAKGKDTTQDDVGSFDPVFIEVPPPGDDFCDMGWGLPGIAKVEPSEDKGHEDVGGKEEFEEAFFVKMIVKVHALFFLLEVET